jgi:hypothetical protein
MNPEEKIIQEVLYKKHDISMIFTMEAIRFQCFHCVSHKLIIILCNGGQHYVPYRWLLISNKLCDSTLCTCFGVGGREEQVHNVELAAFHITIERAQD